MCGKDVELRDRLPRLVPDAPDEPVADDAAVQSQQVRVGPAPPVPGIVDDLAVHLLPVEVPEGQGLFGRYERSVDRHGRPRHAPPVRLDSRPEDTVMSGRRQGWTGEITNLWVFRLRRRALQGCRRARPLLALPIPKRQSSPAGGAPGSCTSRKRYMPRRSGAAPGSAWLPGLLSGPRSHLSNSGVIHAWRLRF